MANSFANRWYCCRNARRRDDKVNSVSLLQTFCEFLCISMDSCGLMRFGLDQLLLLPLALFTHSIYGSH